MIVVDASVGVKWFLDEDGSAFAAELLVAEREHISAPDIFAVEVAATLVREANVQKALANDMRLAVARLTRLIESEAISLVRTSPANLADTVDLAIDIGHPLKDCLYLTLAMELGCPLITADAKFAAKARGVYGDVRVLGEG